MKFIIASLFAAIATSSAQNDGNWKSNWSASRTLYSAFEVDPNDSRTMMRGSGDIEIGDGVAKFFGSPRMYISHDDASVVGWENVEFTAYGKYVNNTYDRSYSGLTMVTIRMMDVVRLDIMLVFIKVRNPTLFDGTYHRRRLTHYLFFQPD
jgi:hypothetical protein